eukprot:5254977-Prymnesium_polylepis.1
MRHWEAEGARQSPFTTSRPVRGRRACQAGFKHHHGGGQKRGSLRCVRGHGRFGLTIPTPARTREDGATRLQCITG